MSEQTSEHLAPKDKQSEKTPRRVPAGDVRLNENDPDPRARGGQPQEKVEDNPAVGQVSPEDYPDDQKSSGSNNL